MKDVVEKEFSFSYLGPDLSMGPLPCVIYFALSAEDSLQLDPYNQPAVFLSKLQMRVFSITLPFHGDGYSAHHAMEAWAREMEKDELFLEKFLQKCEKCVSFLLKHNYVLEGEIGVMGLSRGGFIATSLAARISEIKVVLGFAPVTDLGHVKEFHTLKNGPKADALHLTTLSSKLYDRKIRFYIGNRDRRVSTESCFQFVSRVTEMAFEHKIRTPLIELFITPSIGMHGHGTSKEIFEEGALWIAKQLGVETE